MKAFVTGGTGFIGSHLVDALLSQQGVQEVRCLARTSLKWLTGLTITPIKGDLEDESALRAGLEGADVVYHCAALVKASDEKTFHHANVEATERLLRLSAECGVRRVVILSSLAAMGPSEARPKRESDPMSPVSMYGRSKQRMEERVIETASSLPGDLSVTIIRPPAVYGPREEQIFTYFKLARWGVSAMIDSGDGVRLSMVHVSDLVEGMLLAGAKTQPGVQAYFISGPEDVTWSQIRKATEKAFHRRSLALRIHPSTVLRIATVLETAARPFGLLPVLNREKAVELGGRWTCDHTKAMEHLGYAPKIGIEDGIRDTIRWYKDNDWL